MRFSGPTQFRAYIEQEREDTWRAALEFIQSLYKKYDLKDWDWTACQIKKDIEQELSNNQTDNNTD